MFLHINEVEPWILRLQNLLEDHLGNEHSEVRTAHTSRLCELSFYPTLTRLDIRWIGWNRQIFLSCAIKLYRTKHKASRVDWETSCQELSGGFHHNNR